MRADNMTNILNLDSAASSPTVSPILFSKAPTPTIQNVSFKAPYEEALARDIANNPKIVESNYRKRQRREQGLKNAYLSKYRHKQQPVFQIGTYRKAQPVPGNRKIPSYAPPQGSIQESLALDSLRRNYISQRKQNERSGDPEQQRSLVRAEKALFENDLTTSLSKQTGDKWVSYKRSLAKRVLAMQHVKKRRMRLAKLYENEGVRVSNKHMM